MTAANIRALLAALHCFVYVGGNNYAKPTQAWLEGEFYSSFKELLWAENVSRWSPRWECRDFARMFACFAQVANAMDKMGPTGEDALAVGEFWFLKDPKNPKSGHAVNICITDNGIIYIDPQTGLLWHMTHEQFESCYFCRF